MESKHIILTGATSGIGFEVAKTLYLKGHHLILGNRNKEKAEQTKDQLLELKSGGTIDLLAIDLSSLSSIKEFAEYIIDKYPKIEVLINNAGVFARRLEYTSEGFEMSKGVNYLGTYYLSELLKDKLKENPDSKIVNVSSVGSYLGKLRIKPEFFKKRVSNFTDYFNSKKANLIHSIELRKELKEFSVEVVAADPGIVYSRIWRWRSGFGRLLGKIQKKIMKDASEGAKIIVELVDSNDLIDENHIMYSSKGPRKLPRQVLNERFRKDFLTFTKETISKHL